MDCGGKRSATPLWIRPTTLVATQKRCRRCALPAQSKCVAGLMRLLFLILNQVRDRRDACSTAGCKFEFSAKNIQPLTKLLREELEKL
jgi:hypothetical protein